MALLYEMLAGRPAFCGNTMVEIYHKGRRVASHTRVHKRGAFDTDPSRMPHEHGNFLEWTPERIKLGGEKIGSQTRMLMEAIMEHRAHPEHGFPSCLGIVRLAKLYTPDRVEEPAREHSD